MGNRLASSDVLMISGACAVCRLQSRMKMFFYKRHEAFFIVKSYKPEYPFRTIVSERGSWPHFVSGYLQKHLESLRLLDSYLVRNPMDVVEYLRTDGGMVSDAFSIDVVDLYYSVPLAPLLQSVKECIVDDNDEVAFRNAGGYHLKVS